MSSRASLSAMVAAILLLTACGEEKVASYRVPKEKEPEPQAAAAASKHSIHSCGAGWHPAADCQSAQTCA